MNFHQDFPAPEETASAPSEAGQYVSPVGVTAPVRELIDPEPLAELPRRHRGATTAQLEHGQLALAKYEAVVAFCAREENKGASWKTIRKSTGVTSVQFCRWNKAVKKARLNWADGATLPRSEMIAALAKKSPPGRRPKYAFNETEADKASAHNLQSNLRADAGSPNEAVKHAIKRGEINPGLADVLRQREADGKPLLTESMRRQVQLGETVVRADRTPRDAWLKYVQSPGSLQLTIDEDTGEERMFEPGEAWTIDDGTINFVCCVPIERPGDKCSDKFGVMVGRFQFIVTADHRSYFIPGFSYTARPRGSYRAEDLTSTIHIAAREHGMPRMMFMEQGISASRLVHETLARAGIRVKHVKSPHQKVVELLFNKLWTKLSFLPGQVGRHMGDDEETTKLLMACRAGSTDPRKHFMMLGDVVKALRESIVDHNSGWINYSRYGRWVPQVMWSEKSKAQLRPLDADCEWMFSPVVTKPLQVRGFTVRNTVRLMDGLSQVFHFGAEWLQSYHGAYVKLFFNPFVDAPAKVVLAEDFKGTKAETILGDAEMVDRHARFNLRKMGYGAFPDIGLAAARQNAQALRRAVVAVRADGKPGVVAVETRDQKHLPTNAQNTAPAPEARYLRRNVGLGVEQDEFERQAQRLAREEERATLRAPQTILSED